MTDIQRLSDERTAAMTPAERVARASAMLRWTREFLARQIAAEEPDCSEELLKLKVAARLYAAEPSVLALIHEQMRRVSSRSV